MMSNFRNIIIVMVMGSVLYFANRSFAGISNSICDYLYNYSYLSFKGGFKAPEGSIVTIKCLSYGKKVAEETIIDYQVVQALEEAKITSEKYRELISNSLYKRCMDNSMGSQPMNYAEYNKYICSSLEGNVVNSSLNQTGTVNSQPSMTSDIRSSQQPQNIGNTETKNKTLSDITELLIGLVALSISIFLLIVYLKFMRSMWRLFKKWMDDVNKKIKEDMEKRKAELINKYTSTLKSATKDNVISAQEEIELAEIKKNGALSDEDLLEANKELDEKRRTGLIEETEELKEIAEEFDITYDGTSECISILEKLKVAKLFGEKYLNNEVAPINNPPVFLKKEEQAYFVSQVVVYKKKTNTNSLPIYLGTRIKLGSLPIYLGGRIPINHSKEVIETIGTGSFVITNNRIILSGEQISCTIKMDSIISVTPFLDGMQIMCEGRYSDRYYIIDEPFNATMLISAILQNKTMEGDSQELPETADLIASPETKEQAMTEQLSPLKQNTSNSIESKWHLIEEDVIKILAALSEEILKDDRLLKAGLEKSYELLPFPVRFAFAKDKFLNYCMVHRGSLIEKVLKYKDNDSKVLPDTADLIASQENKKQAMPEQLNSIKQKATDLIESHWPIIEETVIKVLATLSEEILKDNKLLKAGLEKSYELLPATVRLFLAKDKFMNYCMVHSEQLLEKVLKYKVDKTINHQPKEGELFQNPPKDLFKENVSEGQQPELVTGLSELKEHLAMAQSLLLEKKYDKARDIYQKGTKQFNVDNMPLMIAMTYLGQGKFAEAINLIRDMHSPSADADRAQILIESYIKNILLFYGYLGRSENNNACDAIGMIKGLLSKDKTPLDITALKNLINQIIDNIRSGQISLENEVDASIRIFCENYFTDSTEPLLDRVDKLFGDLEKLSIFKAVSKAV